MRYAQVALFGPHGPNMFLIKWRGGIAPGGTLPTLDNLNRTYEAS